MKRLIGIIIASIIVFILFIKFFMSLFNGTTYSITGSVEEATLDSDGNIVITEQEITEQPTYISYVYEGVTIGLLAIRNSEAAVEVVVNTCVSCHDLKNAYYLLKDNKIVNVGCKNEIAIDDLDSLDNNACSPIRVKERQDLDQKIIIGTKQLRELKDRFVNWNGPK